MAEESGFPAVDGAAVDALAESYQRRGGQPGIAYGVVAGGRLVHAGGFGRDRLPYRVDDEELHRVGGAGPA
jgi:CubicO group peptidase (beta-lactamase class C family)